MTGAGSVYDPVMQDRLDQYLSLAHTRLEPERVMEIEAEVSEPTLELAFELLDARVIPAS